MKCLNPIDLCFYCMSNTGYKNMGTLRHWDGLNVCRPCVEQSYPCYLCHRRAIGFSKPGKSGEGHELFEPAALDDRKNELIHLQQPPLKSDVNNRYNYVCGKCKSIGLITTESRKEIEFKFLIEFLYIEFGMEFTDRMLKLQRDNIQEKTHVFAFDSNKHVNIEEMMKRRLKVLDVAQGHDILRRSYSILNLKEKYKNRFKNKVDFDKFISHYSNKCLNFIPIVYSSTKGRSTIDLGKGATHFIQKIRVNKGLTRPAFWMEVTEQLFKGWSWLAYNQQINSSIIEYKYNDLVSVLSQLFVFITGKKILEDLSLALSLPEINDEKYPSVFGGDASKILRIGQNKMRLKNAPFNLNNSVYYSRVDHFLNTFSHIKKEDRKILLEISSQIWVPDNTDVIWMSEHEEALQWNLLLKILTNNNSINDLFKRYHVYSSNSTSSFPIFDLLVLLLN